MHDYFGKAFNLAIRRKKPKVELDIERLLKAIVLKHHHKDKPVTEAFLVGECNVVLNEMKEKLFSGVDNAEVSEYIKKNSEQTGGLSSIISRWWSQERNMD